MEIVLNGKLCDNSFQTLFQLRDTLFANDCISIINGFQTVEDVFLKSGDIVSIIKKGTMPPKDELESLMSARHTPHIHEKLKQGRVSIAGLGGLGSNIAVMLARIGVGRLLLIDFDIVEPSNLNRQSYYVSHLGMFKTDALKKQLAEINPFIEINTKAVRVTEDNIVSLFKDYDIICEAFDNPFAKAMLVNSILENFPNKKLVCGSGMAGYASSNLIQTRRKMKNLYICGDLENEAKQGNGLMSPRVNICAGHQANMILRILIGETDT